MQNFSNYIAGEWVSSEKFTENRNPSDLSDIIGNYAQANKSQLDRAIESAQQAQKIWAATGLEKRYTVLMSIGEEMKARSAELGELLSREEGKPTAEGKGEIFRAGQFFTYYAAEVLRQMGDTADSVRDGIEIDVRREAVGVVAIISPWNFPTATATWKIAPALAYGNAIPALDIVRPGLAIADAKTGFAHPAIDLGFEWLAKTAREQGIAALGLRNSYNCGILGYHTDCLASKGLLGIGFTNAPASVAPVGGKKAVLGTNPFSVAVPGSNGETRILIDQSASVIAKSEVMKYAREGRAIPEGWALGPDGQPTTDPDVALKGTMIPSGSYKGFGAALMVELMAAALTGATLGIHSSPFSGPVGGPPKTGQFFIAIDPEISSGGAFSDRVDHLIEAITGQDGTHLHGTERFSARERANNDGVAVNAAIVEKVNEWATKFN